MQSLVPSSVAVPASVPGRKGAEAAPAALLSGRPNNGRRPARGYARREWDASDHFGLDTEVRPSAAPRGMAECLPLVRLENPGHSWLFADLAHVAALGVEGRISGYSHIVGSSAALEEDCDAPVVADAIGAAIGRRFDWNDGRGCVRTVYDGLFEWDHAYANFKRLAGKPAGRGVLCPYTADAARRIAHGGATPP